MGLPRILSSIFVPIADLSEATRALWRDRGGFGEKQGSARRPVSRVLSLSGMAIHLGRPLPDASRDLPGRRRENPLGDCSPCRPYLVLLPVGFTVPLPSPGARCALTAPFHPCRPRRSEIGGSGGLLSVALSLGSPPPGVTRHRVSVEPGLSSLDRRRSRAAIRPSGTGRGRPQRRPRQRPLKAVATRR